MHNADLQAQLSQLERTAAQLRKAVADAADLEPLPLAESLVAAVALNARLAKLSGRIRPRLAPLFKPPGDGDQAGGR